MVEDSFHRTWYGLNEFYCIVAILCTIEPCKNDPPLVYGEIIQTHKVHREDTVKHGTIV